uniref:Amidase domain-containing protein n=1 Tax=Rhodnius prolixus TaxID=13249 RepID=T1HPU6_RHOPR
MEIKVRMLGAVQKLLSWLLWPFFAVTSMRSSPSLPSVKSPLLLLSASQLARKIRARKITSRELVDACIERIKEVNPVLNAVVQDRFKEAQQEANDVDDYIAANAKNMEMIENEKPLLGVPFTVKESCGLKGLSQAVGCLPRNGIVATEDGDAVKELRKAGAIPLAVTNTPELCLCWESNNLITGCTRNPFDTNRTSGGSSGGEGALIGAGASLFGIGSDIAGSIRVPAMFNGIFGHKPTPGYVSLQGHFPLSQDKGFQKFLVIGPMARHAEDLPLLLKLLAGERANELNLDKKVDLSKINVFYMEEAGQSLVDVPVAPEIKNILKDAALYLKTNYGCQAERGPFPELADSVEISGTVFLGMEDVPELLDLSQKKGKEEMNLYVETLKSFLGLSEFSSAGLLFMVLKNVNLFIPKSKYEHYYNINEDLKLKFKQVLKDNGVLLYPTFPMPAIHHNEIYTVTAGVMYTMIFNTLELPSTHGRASLDQNFFFMYFQVIAGPHQDRLCLAVANALEEKFGGWALPPI